MTGFAPSRAAADRAPANKESSFLVYGAGENQVPILEACRRKGWRVVAVDRDPDSPGAKVADRFICESLRDHEAIVRAIAEEDFCGVAARVTDPEALASSRLVSVERGLASPCSDLLAAATSKVALASSCLRGGLRTPRRFGPGESVDFSQSSVLIRPDVTLRGKAGVARVQCDSEFEHVRARGEDASANGKIDVSEWIDGYDVSALVQLDRGQSRRIALWDEWVALDPTGAIVGLGCGLPSVFEGRAGVIDETIEKVAACFAESRCLVTLSLRIDREGKPWVIEIHLGVGGDGLADQLIPAAYPELNVFDALVSASVGRDVARPAAPPKACGLERRADSWSLLEAKEINLIRARVCASVPPDWVLPLSLANDRGVPVAQPERSA